MDSDHHPLQVKIRREGEGNRGGKGGQKTWRGIWNEKGRQKFRQKVGGLQGREWEEVEETMERAMKETELELGGERRRRTGWLDEDCERKKGKSEKGAEKIEEGDRKRNRL